MLPRIGDFLIFKIRLYVSCATKMIVFMKEISLFLLRSVVLLLQPISSWV